MVSRLAPCRAVPVSMRPRIGPAQGARGGRWQCPEGELLDNQSLILKAAIVLAYVARSVAGESIKVGELISLLEEWMPRTSPLCLYYPPQSRQISVVESVDRCDKSGVTVILSRLGPRYLNVARRGAAPVDGGMVQHLARAIRHVTRYGDFRLSPGLTARACSRTRSMKAHFLRDVPASGIVKAEWGVGVVGVQSPSTMLNRPFCRWPETARSVR